ncbi:MAG: hypothetical protein WD378_09345, partial [Egicoccus sp.]
RRHRYGRLTWVLGLALTAWVPEGLTAVLEASRPTGDRAEVAVQMRSLATSGPFVVDSGVSPEVFDLVRHDARWRITGTPWPVYDCRGWW